MNTKLNLSIALSSLVALGAISSPAIGADTTQVQQNAPKASKGGGKCASGKCGTEKIYGKATLDNDPDGRLVRARDGKCGSSGKGYAVLETPAQTLAQGICGQ